MLLLYMVHSVVLLQFNLLCSLPNFAVVLCMLLYMVHSLVLLQTQFAVQSTVSCSGVVHAAVYGA